MATAQVRRQKTFQHPTKPVKNVALTSIGLQERKHNIEWYVGGKKVIKINNYKYTWGQQSVGRC